MKKFIGCVNGKNFDNREDFNEAVKKAMENPYEQLVVTSYEKIVPDEEPVKKVEERPTIDLDDITIFRDDERDEKGEYKIPEGIEEKLKNCANRDEVVYSLKRDLNCWNKCREDNDKNIESYKEDIDFANMKIKELTQDNETIDAGIRFYKTLLGYVGETETTNKVEKKPYTRPTVKFDKDLVRDSILDMVDSFGSYLRKKGFF